MPASLRLALLCLILLLSLITDALADNGYEPLFLVRGVRPMGLGNAFEAIADDENAFHYNPAGLAQKDEILFHFLVARPMISSDLADESPQGIKDLCESIDTLMSYDDPLGNQSPECREAREMLANRVEEAIQESLGAKLDLPSIGFMSPFRVAGNCRLALGGNFYTQSLISLRVEPRGLPWSDPIKDMMDDAIVYDISTQQAFEIVGALEIPVNKPPMLSNIYVGVAGRRISRYVFTDADNPFTMEDILNPNGPDGIEGTDDDFAEMYFDVDQDVETFGDLVDLFKSNSRKLTGYTLDLGTIFTAVEGLKFAFVTRNIASFVRFDGKDRGFPRNVVFSTAVKPLILLGEQRSYLDLTLAASLCRPKGDDDMYEYLIDRFTDRIHLGAEAVIFPGRRVSLAARIGNNQGFPTFGTSLKLGALHLDFVRYADLQTDWYAGYVNLNLSILLHF